MEAVAEGEHGGGVPPVGPAWAGGGWAEGHGCQGDEGGVSFWVDCDGQSSGGGADSGDDVEEGCSA